MFKKPEVETHQIILAVKYVVMHFNRKTFEMVSDDVSETLNTSVSDEWFEHIISLITLAESRIKVL